MVFVGGPGNSGSPTGIHFCVPEWDFVSPSLVCITNTTVDIINTERRMRTKDTDQIEGMHHRNDCTNDCDDYER